MFARAAFSTGYYSPGDIFAMLGRGMQVEKADDLENMRFYALLHVLNGRGDEGIKLLHARGKTSDTIEGQLYSAALQCIAKRYTNSIMEYKNILVRTTSGEVLKLVHINLGRIYYTQSLYNESLLHFENALSIDRDDVQSKIWMGKNYSAMGNKLKARAIWSEVLAADASNEEVRRLLKLM
jgi:tetratricopeptide (TPR) repeat protein